MNIILLSHVGSLQFQKYPPPAILCIILIIHYLIIVLLGQIDPLKFQKVPPPTVSIVVRPLAYYLIIMFLCHYGQLLVAKINPPPPPYLSF